MYYMQNLNLPININFMREGPLPKVKVWEPENYDPDSRVLSPSKRGHRKLLLLITIATKQNIIVYINNVNSGCNKIRTAKEFRNY